MFGYIFTAIQLSQKNNDIIHITAFSIVKSFQVMESLRPPMNHSMNSDLEGLAGSGFQAGMCRFCRPGRLRCTHGLSFFTLEAEVGNLETCKGRKGCRAFWGV